MPKLVWLWSAPNADGYRLSTLVRIMRETADEAYVLPQEFAGRPFWVCKADLHEHHPLWTPEGYRRMCDEIAAESDARKNPD